MRIAIRHFTDRGVIDAKVDTQDCGLGEHVADLTFELEVKSSAEQSSHVN